LKSIFSNFISKEQFGFLFKCQIYGIVSITQEALLSIKKKNIPSVILKLDLSKAYDRDNWTFIRLVLIQLGMNLESINWIMGCLESSSSIFLINVVLSYFLYPQEALGKGYLFPLVVLSRG